MNFYIEYDLCVLVKYLPLHLNATKVSRLILNLDEEVMKDKDDNHKFTNIFVEYFL